jgi:hypothetical protein
MEKENVTQDRAKQVYDSLKDQDGLKLSQKKGSLVQDLSKVLKQIGEIDVTKGKEREKLFKLFDKVNDIILSISVVERLLKEKDF